MPTQKPVIQAVVTPEVVRALAAEAKAVNRSVSSLVGFIVIEWFRRRKRKDDTDAVADRYA